MNSLALTEKMKKFAREYFYNGGNGTAAYLSAYDTNNRVTASRESFELLKKPEILEYIKTLNIPQENKAISEREKKRQWLWDMINNPNVKDSDRISAMNILNKMDSEYINITQTIDEKETSIEHLDTKTLKALTAV